MIWFLRLLAVGVLGSMLGVTSWASLQCPLFAVPREVATHPWFLATLVDAYWGFVAFFVWVAWKERTPVARGCWFVAIMLWGNIAMAVYALRELFTVNSSAELSDVITRRNPGRVAVPVVLALAGVAVYVFAWSARPA
jgi:hypothetical protein